MNTNVSNYYNNNVEQEWRRLEKCFVEDYIVKKYFDLYIPKGASVLDLGGGPGRYSLYLSQKNRNVLLIDIADNNINFALEKAKELNCKIRTMVGDARNISFLTKENFDCILLLGPIYHMVDETERMHTIAQCVNLLNENGRIFISFISSYARIIYALREHPEEILTNSLLQNDLNKNLNNQNIYRKNPIKFLIQPDQIESMMNKFTNLKKLNIIGCEGILGPYLNQVPQMDFNTQKKWIEYAYRTSDKKNAIFYSEHIMYIGEKNEL